MPRFLKEAKCKGEMSCLNEKRKLFARQKVRIERPRFKKRGLEQVGNGFCFYSPAYATDETKLWLGPSAKPCRNSCSGAPPVYPDLSTRHDWPVKNAIVNLPNREKRNLKRISGNSLRPLRAQNKDISAAL